MAAVNAFPRQVESELIVGDRQDRVVGVGLSLGHPVEQQAVPPAVLFLLFSSSRAASVVWPVVRATSIDTDSKTFSIPLKSYLRIGK